MAAAVTLHWNHGAAGKGQAPAPRRRAWRALDLVLSALSTLHAKRPSDLGSFRVGPVTALARAGALGGRLDHVLSALSTLHAWREHELVLCGDGNLVRLLRPGPSVLAPDRALEGPACGLVALGRPATASSHGLKWNLGAPACPPAQPDPSPPARARGVVDGLLLGAGAH